MTLHELIPLHVAEISDDGLPDWGDCSVKLHNGETLTALERFIHENEPAGKEDCAEFRAQLAAVVAEVRNERDNAQKAAT